MPPSRRRRGTGRSGASPGPPPERSSSTDAPPDERRKDPPTAHAPAAPSRRLILDTSAVLNGTWSGSGEGLVAPPAVAAEFSPGGRDRARWDRLVASGLAVVEPEPGALRRASEAAASLGETRLSPADREVAALALTLAGRDERAPVVTDDYALQNLLAFLRLPWQGAREAGITEVRRYVLRCVGCRRTYAPDAGLAEKDHCPICGSALSRKRA